MRRVVVTGVGFVCPLGCGGDAVFQRLVGGANGVSKLNLTEDMQQLIPATVRSAAVVPVEGSIEMDLCDSLVLPKTAINKSSSSSLFIDYALHATEIAISEAFTGASPGGLKTAGVNVERAGVAIGNGGIGSLMDIEVASAALHNSPRRLSPYFVPKVLVNMAAGQVSIKYGLKGPVHSVATACAAGAHSVGDAFNFIRLGYADLMIAGGTDASINPLAIAGFARMRALALNDDKSDETDYCNQSRPFHSQRKGFVIGEGAGVLVLEDLESALRRGAPIVAEVCGYGLSGDANHATAPSEDGDGAFRSMRSALRDAQVSASAVGYINAHATSTPLGDAAEIRAIRRVFGSSNRDSDPPFVSSTKGATGHLLGAAGAVEIGFTAMALANGTFPPTLHLDNNNLDAELQGKEDFSHIMGHSLQYDGIQYAMSNSFGFGGTNVSVVLRRWKETDAKQSLPHDVV